MNPVYKELLIAAAIVVGGILGSPVLIWAGTHVLALIGMWWNFWLA